MRATKSLPAFTLFVLAPMIGELLSGSSPPSEFFNPVPFLLLASLYGSGAIVVRELKVRWNKDFKAMILLGAAYGILEEGLMVKSSFDPNWMDLGILGSFGRWLGVNWVWAEMLTIYHAVFSTTIPIVLVELAYPKTRNERWTSERTFKCFVALLLAVTAIGFFFLTPYVPPLPQYLLTIVATVLFVYIAYRLPTRKAGIEPGKTGKTRSLFVAGLRGTVPFFLIYWTGPYVFDHPIIVMILALAMVSAMLRILKDFDRGGHASSLDRLAIVSGALLFLIIITPLHEPGTCRTDNPAGMTLVGIAALAGLLILRYKIKTGLRFQGLTC